MHIWVKNAIVEILKFLPSQSWGLRNYLRVAREQVFRVCRRINEGKLAFALKLKKYSQRYHSLRVTKNKLNRNDTTNHYITPPPKTASELDRASDTGSVKKCNSAIRLKQCVWKQLLYYLGSRDVNQSVRNKFALLKSTKRLDSYGYLQREEILDRTVTSKNREQAHKLLIEACDELIADLSKDLGGAA